MHRRESQQDRELTVAIVGGGASGTLLAVQLLQQSAAARLPLRIWLIDEHGRHGLGQAYATQHPGHLLNAMAGRMSALPTEPDHLMAWAGTSPAVPGQVSRGTFLPRRAYGRYLLETLAAAERAALPFGGLTRITAAVTAIRPRFGASGGRLHTSSGPLDADVVVLATGNVPAPLPFDAPSTDAVITDPWRPAALDTITNGNSSSRCRVVVVGTGLTMADIAIAITSARPGSVVHAVSRHGLLPRVHRGYTEGPRRSFWLPAISDASGSVRLSDLLWQVRQEISASPDSWYQVFEGLRPHVPSLWSRLPDDDKRAFLRHLARYWEVHRHLMPPATAARICALQHSGQLVVHRGLIRAARYKAGRLAVLADTAGDRTELDADWLINSSGGTTDVTVAASPLLANLFSTGMARPDPLRLGIDANPAGTVLGADGRPSTFLHALGPPLRGLWYETTAIPEIRGQAAALAEHITKELAASRSPGSAA
jgi:uncharacterized NAD(P)/FAD-binding protein YdhS